MDRPLARHHGQRVATETLEVTYQEIIGLGALGGLLAGAMSVSANVSVGF